jgi:hypothetical protein
LREGDAVLAREKLSATDRRETRKEQNWTELCFSDLFCFGK